jgi:hypothetical protein
MKAWEIWSYQPAGFPGELLPEAETLNRKEHKERKESGGKERGFALATGRVLRPDKLA